ncbi:MAG: cupredoxin domain-containing protein, partial [Nitrosotalea sp.]
MKTLHLSIIVIVGIGIAFSAYLEVSHIVNTSVSITSGSGASTNPDCVSTRNCFYPNPLTISRGDTVTWTNKDSLRHTVVSGIPTGEVAGTIFDSKIIEPGQTFKFTFTNAGTYDYFCILHPWLQGQVI